MSIIVGMPIPMPHPSAILSLVLKPPSLLGLGVGAEGEVTEDVLMLVVDVALSSTCFVIRAVLQLKAT